ncbi:MAG: cold shock domain-containing protein [Dehalococcoidales bacterium]
MSQRIGGVIKWYNTKKHFGYLLSDNREVFFHVNDCGDLYPQEGTLVEFEMGLDRIGRPKAINIKSVCVGGSNEYHS